MSIQKDYEEVIRFLKKEHNMNGWNALDICVKDILEMTETDNAEACAEALRQCMLEGDIFLNERGAAREVKVRYYCDNLSDSRRKLFW